MISSLAFLLKETKFRATVSFTIAQNNYMQKLDYILLGVYLFIFLCKMYEVSYCSMSGAHDIILPMILQFKTILCDS